MDRPTAAEIIKHLSLIPLPEEGGFFRQTVCSPQQCADGIHPIGTLIYFLMTPDGFSAMHRLPNPEIWIWQLGDPAEMLLLHPDGSGELRTLGPDLAAGHSLQLTTPANAWQGTRILPTSPHHGYTLVSCMMSPGFHESDFELGERDGLSRAYPDWTEAIAERTRVVGSEPG